MDKRSRDRVEQIVSEALKTSEFAWWEWDIARNRVKCNDLKVTMLGYDPSDFKDIGYEAFTDLLHPDDHERTMDAMRDHLQGRAPLYQIDYRIKRADGAYTWYVDRGIITERSGSEEPLKLRGIVLDLGSEMREKTKEKTILEMIRKAIPGGMDEQIIHICAGCRKLKISKHDWVDVDAGFLKAVSADLSHSVCPECVKKLYPEMAGKISPES
ncbi:MAG: PAS domain-containing protein [Candidatus Omnitrophica bacterium]|nr:PAS domain-containing protein [Candidatus Omnitrophota bacterium]